MMSNIYASFKKAKQLTWLLLSIGYVYIMAEDFLVGDCFCMRNDTEEQFFDKNVQELTNLGCATLFHFFSSSGLPS